MYPKDCSAIHLDVNRDLSSKHMGVDEMVLVGLFHALKCRQSRHPLLTKRLRRQFLCLLLPMH